MRSPRIFFPLSLCLLLMPGLPGWVGSAAAQQQDPPQEKRIALVVGDGAYDKAPLATAANDAGLIAQTLQAAGFDVIGARDLDGDTLRKSFRDFIQKAEGSGANTVAVIYLSGYGVQLAGENYFIPVDSAINHDTDIPIEGLRISDYTRQLAAIPLKASVIVLDAARQQPFIESGQPIASGLALVEPENNMLIAFNAAPGTVGPSEQGPYGSYAQSLAEMIRTGGLSLPELFERVRLRVNEASKGAQVPWDAQKIQAQFTFFERAPDAPPTQGPADQVAAIRDRPIRDLPVQDAYAAALDRDTLQGYEDFVLAFPNDPSTKRVRAIIAARREAITWRGSYRADTPEAYWSYLRRYPRGPHAGDARRRLAILTSPLEPPASFVMMDYDVPPPAPDEIAYFDRPVLYFGDPDFDFVPPPPPPVFFLPPPPPDFVVLPPPIAPVGLFILPQPLFVPMPIFVRPPVYVAPPPNNIIFTNIHNTTVINNVINVPPAQAAAGAAAPGAPQRALTAAAAAGGPAGATPPVPPSVRQQATLIQQGRAPVPRSASIIPSARTATPGALPANVAPTSPGGPPTGTRLTPLPTPSLSGRTPAGAPPSARLKPSTPSPSGAAPAGAAAGARPTPSPAGRTPGGAAPAARLTPSPPTPSSQTPAHTPARPAPRLTSPPPPPPHPAARVVPSPSRPAARPASPPPPAARVAPPPPPVARAAPPPPRPAPPPPAVRAAPPPPVAHAAPPPPRPGPPRPAAPAAARRCPPNQPRC